MAMKRRNAAVVVTKTMKRNQVVVSMAMKRRSAAMAIIMTMTGNSVEVSMAMRSVALIVTVTRTERVAIKRRRAAAGFTMKEVWIEVMVSMAMKRKNEQVVSIATGTGKGVLIIVIKKRSEVAETLMIMMRDEVVVRLTMNRTGEAVLSDEAIKVRMMEMVSVVALPMTSNMTSESAASSMKGMSVLGVTIALTRTSEVVVC